MTPLQQTALDFCRECLGWEKASIFAVLGCIGNGKLPGNPSFDYTDLNAVMEAVRGWCVRNKLGFTICCDESGFEVAVFSAGFEEIDEEATNQNLCHALLAACVAASRNLKTA